MFGKGLTKIISLAIAGAIALAAGAQLLASVVSVVLAFRFGNIIPLAIVVILTVVILIVANRFPEESSARTIIKILSYAVTGYLAVTVFVIALPYGLIVSIIAAGAVGVFSSIIGEQQTFWKHIRESLQFENRFSGLPIRSVPVGNGTSFRLNSLHTIVILEEGTREKLVHLMKERPLLPISLTRYEDCDILFIAEENDPSRCDRIMKLLKESDIGIKDLASPLLAEAIQMVPILDSRNGLKFEDYRIARDDKTISSLLTQAPSRLTIIPSVNGLLVLIPEFEAPGLNVDRLKHGCEADVLLDRNYSHLKEAEKPIESTT
ncbi:MAG: hypothetical protein OEV85_14315 [Candidatus Thorarchaeota archaeon]|nr:hypothetical protein [Candidatus Thorarchaeota archaeon]